MNWTTIPWTELSIVMPILGGLLVPFFHNTERAARWSFGVSFLTLVTTSLSFLALHSTGTQNEFSVMNYWFGKSYLAIDAFSAPLLVMIAILHFLTVLATSRVKANRMSFGGHLVGEGFRLAGFACIEPWPLIFLYVLSILPPYLELSKRGKPTFIYLTHMLAFSVLLVLGWFLVEAGYTNIGSVMLLIAILIRSGTLPAHLWVANLFEHATFGTALLFVTPIAGMYAAVRLLMPVAPDWILQSLGIISLLTALYSAGMAIVQIDSRRFFAYLFLSYSSLVMVGMELHTPNSLTGALCLWLSVSFSLTCLGLTIRALEARFGRMSLKTYLGLYEQSPTLAVGFLFSGLASVGFPGTVGYVASEMLMDGILSANPLIGIGLIFAAALNGIAVVRAYLLLFTGSTPRTNMLLAITNRERIAVLVFTGLVMCGGLFPAPGVIDRHNAAEQILKNHKEQDPNAAPAPAHN